MGNNDEVSKTVQDQLQTFVFSATMSKDLQRNLKKRHKVSMHGKKGFKPASTLGKKLLNDIVNVLDVYVQMNYSSDWTSEILIPKSSI
jgi:superfamily II DNA/RNA helicase